MILQPLPYPPAAGGLTVRSSSLVITPVGSSYNALLPTGAQAGDLLILVDASAYVPSVTTTGGTTFDTYTGVTNISALSWRKVLDASDISNGYIGLSFAGPFSSIIGMVCFSGNPTGFRTSGFFGDTHRDSDTNVAASTALSTPQTGDVVLYYSLERIGSPPDTASVVGNPGTLLQTATGSDWTGIIRADVLASSGTASASFHSALGTAGDYCGLIVIQP